MCYSFEGVIDWNIKTTRSARMKWNRRKNVHNMSVVEPQASGGGTPEVPMK